MEWLMLAMAGVIGVAILFKTPSDNTPADYEKGWRDFYK